MLEIHYDVASRLIEMKRKFPAGYPCNRNGIRLGMAALEDELKEMYEAWRVEKREPFNDETNTYDELLDVIAVGLYLLERFHDAR